MGVPATTGRLFTSLAGMEVGDYIVCNYQASSGAVGTFHNLGGSPTIEIPVTGTATPNGSFYFIKVDKGLLIADRVVQRSISWATLNTGKLIQGLPLSLVDGIGNTVECLIRSLTGGVAYADQNGNRHTDVNIRQYGGYPTNNEFVKYIMRSNLNGKATPDDDNVWHYENNFSWTQDTTFNGSTYRSIVGKGNSQERIGAQITTNTLTNVGFRPVLEYKEV